MWRQVEERQAKGHGIKIEGPFDIDERIKEIEDELEQDDDDEDDKTTLNQWTKTLPSAIGDGE
jgi:hypothetical protein